MIRLGPSGFSYDDWIGPVYPPDLPRVQWLPFIAQEFDTLELNVTYYRVPSARTVTSWATRTPDDLTFKEQARRSLTHERDAPDFATFRAALQPLIEAGKLMCVLAQFPYPFRATKENRDYLLRLREGLADVPLAVEFRNRDWLRDETFDLLEELRMGICCVDEPRLRGLMPPIARATGPLAYVRFHGRNAKRWWNHEHAWQRYDYEYKESELREWVPRLRRLEETAPLVLVYANNHYRGQSIDTLRKLRRLLALAER